MHGFMEGDMVEEGGFGARYSAIDKMSTAPFLLCHIFCKMSGELCTIPPIDKMSGEMTPFLHPSASIYRPPGGASVNLNSYINQACSDTYIATLSKLLNSSVTKMSGESSLPFLQFRGQK